MFGVEKLKDLAERQAQAIRFLEISLARCYQEKLSSADMLIEVLRIMSPQLEQDGLKLFIGTNSDTLYRVGLTMEARRFIQQRNTQEEVELDA